MLGQLFGSVHEEYMFWNLLYSITDRNELTSALRRFALAHGISSVDAFVEALKVKPLRKNMAPTGESNEETAASDASGQYRCGDELADPAKRTKGTSKLCTTKWLIGASASKRCKTSVTSSKRI